MGESFKHWLDNNDSTLWRAGRLSYKDSSQFDCAVNLLNPGDGRAEFRSGDYAGIEPCGNSLFDTTSFVLAQGVPAKWFQLLADGLNPPCQEAEITPVGITLASRLAFNTNLIGWAGIEFNDAARQSCFAALDFGESGDDTALAQAVHQAWEAVGILEVEDPDADGYWTGWDNCPDTANPDQADATGDRVGDACCCIGIRGNINGDLGQTVDISDLTFLVSYMFKGGPVPPCPEESNINGIGTVDITDLTYLVSYMFKSGSAPGLCDVH
jgi:hypothetical protein